MKTFLKLSLALFFFVLASTTHAFVFEAQFTDTGDAPITTVSTIELRLFNPTKSCLLFEETYSIDLFVTDGKVSVPLGSGTPTFVASGLTIPVVVLGQSSQMRA